MTKKLIVGLLVTMMLLTNVGITFAAGVLTFVEVRHDMDGVKFVFSASRTLSAAELKTELKVVGGKSYDMDCGFQKDTMTVVCKAPQKLGNQNVNFYLGGQLWEMTVPAGKAVMAQTSCYSYLVNVLEAEEAVSYFWTDYTSVCWDTPAQAGVRYDFPELEIDPDLGFYYSATGPNCNGVYNPGEGLYTPNCPGEIPW